MINWKWPNTPDNDICPLYVIVWRLPWYMVMSISRLLFALAVWGCYLSYTSFLEAWDNNG